MHEELKNCTADRKQSRGEEKGSLDRPESQKMSSKAHKVAIENDGTQIVCTGYTKFQMEDIEWDRDSETSQKGAIETSKGGSVDIKLYWKYAKAGSTIIGIIVLIISTATSHGLLRFSDAWLSWWTRNEVLSKMSNLSSYFCYTNDNYNHTCNTDDAKIEEFNKINYYYMLVYGFSVGGIVIGFAIMICRFYTMCITASRKLHNQMFNKILCAPTRFFDLNPKGRILNRFSKDIGTMDDILPTVFIDVLQISLQIIGIVFVVVYKLWWMIFPTALLTFVFYFARMYYVRSSVAIKRVEGISKSPIFSHLASTLNGLSTIRCCGAEEQLIQEFDHLQDLHTSAWYCFLATSRWLGVCCDWIVFFYLCLCPFPFILIRLDNVGGSDVGLVIGTTLALTGMLQYGMRQTAELENQMTSVERVMEYGDIRTEEESNEKTEPSSHNEPTIKESSWPSSGTLEFREVCLQYGENGRYVLKNVSFRTEKEQKIGIVGRTGAGKSSLITALYRLTEPKGDILIDGQSIKSKKLKDLRESISIIPQDPVLFSGSLRMNLDPFNCYSDGEIWKVLSMANLDAFVLTLPKALQHLITEGGDNLSVGQRQLMCLARALLRKTKILVLDEATANVDLKTDELIQKTIRNEFKECTVLTIAHRLNTIMDYSKILVLDQGEVVEYDTPKNLMSDKTTIFHAMCVDARLI